MPAARGMEKHGGRGCHTFLRALRGGGGGTSSTPDGFHVPLYYSHTFLGLHFSSSTILDVSKLI